MLADWVFADNLRAFLTALGWFVGCSLDDEDWTAIHRRVEGTDEEAGPWFDYDFTGEHAASLRLAADPGASVIHVRIEVPAPAEPNVEAAISIFQHFRVRPGP